jgi:flagellar biosynthesis protein FlhG
MKNNRLVSFNNQTQLEKAPFIVSVLSGKGGVGKSVITFNLAALMASQGDRCLIIDADWYFGNQHILCNLVPEHSLIDILNDHASAASSIINVRENLDLIASPSAVQAECDFDGPSFVRFVASMRNLFAQYNFVFIDVASGFSELILLAANGADMNLIVLNPELTSISDGYGLFKYLLKSNRKITAHFLNNRVKETSEYDYIIQKLTVLSQKFLKTIPFDAGYLLEDKLVVESVALQKPLIDLASEGSIIDRFREVAKIINIEKDENMVISRDGLTKYLNSENLLADIKE